MADVELILRKLKRVRRRLFFFHLINSLSIGLCVLAFIVALLSFRGVAGVFSGVTAACACGAVGVASIFVAFFRSPGLKATAKLVDRKLALQQRIETALECITPHEEIDRLILKDAAQRMSHVDPAAIVPVRFAQFARVAFGSGLITLAGLALIRFLEGWNRGDFIEQKGRQRIAGQAPVQTGESPSVVPKNAETRSAGSSAAYGFSAAAPDAASARRPADIDPNRAVNSAAGLSNPTTGSGIAPAASREGASGQGASQGQAPNVPAYSPAQPSAKDPRGAPGAMQSPQAQARPQGRAGDAAGLSYASSGASSIRAAAGSDAAPSSPTAGSSAAGRGAWSAAASGGVPQPVGRQSTSAVDAAFMARYAREYAAYRLAAEEALTREKIPPGFRKYIADYFASIHP